MSLDSGRLSSLPAYLINLKPELRIDGVVVATGGAIGMGMEEDFSIGLSSPAMSPQSIRNKVTAGEYNGIALDIAKISADQMTSLKTKLEATKTKLQNNDLTGITKDDIMGDLLYTTALSYFAELDVMDFMSSKNMGIAATRLPSAGRFFMALSTSELFGVITNASAGGLTMDIGLIKNASTALDGNYDKKIQFMMTSGTNSSALEHSVPEQLFSTPENPAQGLSAVKALQIANEQGIPIYTINQTNINTVLPQLQIDAQAKNDIINAVNAGKVVTVSKTNINFNGWIGCGYIIINPNTGAGAYMISGGMNGGWMLVAYLTSILIPIAAPDVFEAFLYDNYEFVIASIVEMFYIYICYPNIGFGPFVIVAYDTCVSHYGEEAVMKYLECVTETSIKAFAEKGALQLVEELMIHFLKSQTKKIEYTIAALDIIFIVLDSIHYAACNNVLTRGN